MSKRKDPELASLAARKKEALAHKQAIYADLQRVRRATGLAYQAMQDAWQARSSAKERMDDEYSSLQDKIEANQVIWDEYGRICSQNNTRIDALRADANCEHRDMITCFEHASDAYQYGDRAEAPIYSRQGYEHQARRNELNAEISALIQDFLSIHKFYQPFFDNQTDLSKNHLCHHVLYLMVQNLYQSLLSVIF